jgi:hypothetical protein
MMRDPPNVFVMMQSTRLACFADRQHALGMGQVPRLAAVALLESRDHQLRAHRAVAEQRPFAGFVLQTICHRPSSS